MSSTSRTPPPTTTATSSTTFRRSVVDPYAQPHVAGSQTYQTVTVLDGLNVTQPSNGQLLLHVSTDAFRSIRVEPSRYSAEFGKGSGGVILLETGIGDDHYRFIATDFIPSWQNKNGWKFDQFNPRLTLSGPVVKGKIWFFDALDGAYQNVIVTELPDDQNEDVVTRLGNLAKVQANLTSRNILTTSFNLNEFHDQHAGLSPQNPQVSTPAVDQPAYQGGIKDQHYFAGGSLFEVAFGFNRYDLNQISRGVDPYFVSPETAGGNYYLTAHTRADRWQVVSNLYLRPREWHGRHDFKVGIDLDRLRYDANYLRNPISYLREGQRARATALSPVQALALLTLLGLPGCPRTHPAQHRTQRIRSGSLAPHCASLARGRTSLRLGSDRPSLRVFRPVSQLPGSLTAAATPSSPPDSESFTTRPRSFSSPVPVPARASISSSTRTVFRLSGRFSLLLPPICIPCRRRAS